MNIKTFDIVLLIILSIAVSMIIGYNILYIIDKKLSSVNINIPSVQVPQANIVIKVINKGDGNYDYKVEQTLEKIDNQKIMNNNLIIDKSKRRRGK